MSAPPEKRLTKLQILVTDTELETIDNWRFDNRADNRSSAIRELIALGLRYAEQNKDDAETAIRELRDG